MADTVDPGKQKSNPTQLHLRCKIDQAIPTLQEEMKTQREWLCGPKSQSLYTRSLESSQWAHKGEGLFLSVLPAPRS